MNGTLPPDFGELNSIAKLRKSGWFELLKLAVGLRRRFRVEGNSMLPLLLPNDEVLITTNSNVSLIQGDIVVARHPVDNDFILIKRIESIDDDGMIELVGLNRDKSTDSRDFGRVKRKDILGKVTSLLADKESRS